MAFMQVTCLWEWKDLSVLRTLGLHVVDINASGVKLSSHHHAFTPVQLLLE